MKKHITAILGLLFVAACSKAPAQSATTSTSATTPAQAATQPATPAARAPPAPPKPVPAQLPEILAKVNGRAHCQEGLR